MILDLLYAAARGTYPPANGVTEVVPAVDGAGAEVLFGPGEDFLRRRGGDVRVA